MLLATETRSETCSALPRLPGYAMRTSPHGIAGRGRISSLAVRDYQALHPITDRMRDRHYTEGNEEMLSYNFPRSNRLCSCNEETQGREQEQSPSHTDHDCQIERSIYHWDQECSRDDKFGSECGKRGFPDLTHGDAVLRLFRHMDAQGIGHRVGDGDRHNAADHDGARVASGMQSHHQAKRGNDPRRQSKADPGFPGDLHACGPIVHFHREKMRT